MNIKLKVWDNEQGKFLEIGDEEGQASPRYYKHLYFVLVGKVDDDGYDYEIDAETFLYTGMSDRKGKEICAGDIVNFYHSEDKELSVYGSVVEYKQEWCGFYFGGNRRLNSRMRIEVIGNIKEHRHLIKTA
ncbi:hypothetical protein CVD28_00575 [Bacillus sp. M6-12]|uniref:YopX family protein n=1 Tax=Bacillus sp. M6-12 TaxID=2054166 RepID=UPI000C7562E3|nr:YopX family protein [Bacillus sp. M6-12]PLS18929.1 hypothetical protein CVD28_00575 [Bacillus sp. M6-12]